MKNLIVASAVVFLFLIPIISCAQPGQNEQKVPPISQPFIREGDFAVKLVEVLKLGTARNEAEAESRLASMGIAPQNGWIADYPLTPDIIGEVRRAIGSALDSGKLAMNKHEALMAVQILIDSQWRQLAAPGKEQAREYDDHAPTVSEGYDPYYNPEPYYSPDYPYPYYGYYYPYLFPYPYLGGGFVIRGSRWGGRGRRH